MGGLLDRVYDRIRHPDATRVADAPEDARGLAGLAGHEYCVLVTYRSDGTPVPTPVWFGLSGGKLYARTAGTAAKVRRIRANGRARVAACGARGGPVGDAVTCTAVVVSGADTAAAEAAIQSNYGLRRRLYSRFIGGKDAQYAYLELSPLSSSDRAAPLPPTPSAG
jgi:hypothetical protein